MSLVYLAIALAYAWAAWLMWFRAVPTFKRYHRPKLAIVAWLLGMGLACRITAALDLAMMDAPFAVMMVMGDVCAILSAVMLRRHSLGSGDYRWGQCPGHGL